MKIFGLGLAKTGSNSLNNALKVLGYSSIHGPKNWKQIDDHEGVTDVVILFPFEDIYKRYPHDKYILMVRDNDKWIDSLEYQYFKNLGGRPQIQIDRMIEFYGTYNFNRTTWINRKIKHEHDVKESFKGNPNFITMDICGGVDGWDILCNFLDKDVPDIIFPHSNKRKVNRKKKLTA